MSSEAHSISLVAPVVLLAAAVIAVPIFKRIGLGNVRVAFPNQSQRGTSQFPTRQYAKLRWNLEKKQNCSSYF
jgi:hypothetical protein